MKKGTLKHGGARPGSGPKSKGPTPSAAITIHLSPGELFSFKLICADNNTTQREQLRRWIKHETLKK
jgi:hypothetical protein